jgi:hypothetical protein
MRCCRSAASTARSSTCRAVGDRPLSTEAQAIMRHVVVADFRSDAAELTELLAEPEPLPKLAAVSVMTIYRRLVEEHQTNQRLRARLRTMLSV